MSIRKRTLPSGEIRWQFDYRDQGGVRRAKMFLTKGSAAAYETTVRGEIKVGTHVADSASITVSEAADTWLVACEAAGLEYTTVRQYRNHVRLHIKPLIGELKLSRLTAPAAQDFVERLTKDRARPTVRKVLVSLKSLISEAVRRGLAAQNPVREVRIARAPRGDDEPAEFPSMDEIKLLLARAAGDLRPFIHTCMFCGLRPSEVRGLRWEDVDLKESVVRVRQRADRLNKIGRPKSKAGRRDIPLGPHMLTVLREWKLAQPGEQRAGGFVFPDATGAVEDHTTLYRRFGALQLECGVSEPRLGADGKPVLDKKGRPERRQKYGLHAMRHACASLLIAEGWQPKRIQAFLGHASIGLTFDTYGHLFKDAAGDQAAMTKLESGLLG